MAHGYRPASGRGWAAGVGLLALLAALPLLTVGWLAITPSQDLWTHLIETVLAQYLYNTLSLGIRTTDNYRWRREARIPHARDPFTFLQLLDDLWTELMLSFPAGCGVELIAEPGRFFVSSAQTLAVSVIGRKYSGEGAGATPMSYVNDGLYGSFNCILYDHATVTPHLLPTRAAHAEEAAHETSCSLWGPTW